MVRVDQGKNKMNKIATPYEKSLALESQVINLALYDRHACSLLYDVSEDDFLDSHNKSIKLIINRMMEERKAVTAGSVYNEIVGKDFREYFVSISTNQLIADIDTVFMQFSQYHRMVKMLPMIEKLNHSCSIGHPEFDEQFDEVSDFFSTSKVSQEAIRMKDLMARKPEEIREQMVRFVTKIPSVDRHIKFLYGGQYITIAAAPGEGKTTLATIIAENIPNSLIMSYEMSAEEIHDIMVSRKARVDSQRIETDELEFPERRAIEVARRELARDTTLLVCDQNLNMPEMFGFIKRSVRRYGVQCVVIDYAQIIPGLPGKGTQTEKFEMLSRRFKNLARELKIVVIALSQLNKDSIKEGRAPNLSDLRGSLSFGADADKVIFLYTPPDDEVLGRGSTCMALGKNRKGRIGKVDDFFYQKEIHFMR